MFSGSVAPSELDVGTELVRRGTYTVDQVSARLCRTFVVERRSHAVGRLTGERRRPARKVACVCARLESEAWQETVGEGSWKVTAIERHWKGGALYLRWRERRDDGRTDWRYRSLGRTLRTQSGRVIAEAALLTPDLGGTASTSAMGDAIASAL